MSTALQTPDIWGTIPCVDVKWAMLMLERSKMADLVLNVRLTKFPLSVIKGMLDNHSSRIREIRIDWATKSVMSELLKDVPVSSLRPLRSLQLGADPSLLPLIRPRFPGNILGELHGLRHLCFSSFDFWPSALPSNLASLTLYDIHGDYRPSISAFIATLQSMPALESLHLQNSLPLALNVVKLDTMVVLGNLRHLRLSSKTNIHEISNILPLLVVPQTTTIHLSCAAVYSQISATPLSDLVSSLSTFLHNLNSESDEKVPYKILNCSAGVFRAKKDKANCRDDFVLDVLAKSYLPSQILHEVFPAIPLLDVQALTLRTRPYEAGSLVETFGKLPKLCHVEIDDWCISQFMRALIYEPENPDPDEVSQSLSFPALQSIRLKNVSLRCGVDDEQPIGMDPDELVDCLRKRCVRDFRLQKLILSECFYVNEMVVERLREVVDVKWDGVKARDIFEVMGCEIR